ncbi:hypothetical protein C8R46DRAFT_1354110 [Mycena filopes]|nr:hypothetical protein C8R46DRAFT_1354110 [Mycena filopes]
MSVAEAPQDVLLEVFKQLDLVDLFSFLSVCRAVRDLQWQKSLWLHALVRIREVEMHPLPLSPATKLDSMSCKELQNVAQRAHRLTKNLKSDKPMPITTRTLAIETYASCVCLPGSNLLVTHSDGFVSCWDILTSRRVAHLQVATLRIMDKPRIHPDGRALFGARLQIDQFAAVYIDYRDLDRVSISHVTSPPTDALHWHGHSGFFMDSSTMGFCTSASTVSWSVENAGEVKIGTKIVPEMIEPPPGRCLLLGQNIYMLYQAGGKREVHIERHDFSRTADELATASRQRKSWALSVPYPFADERIGDATSLFFHPPHVQVPEYGVYAVSRTIFDWGTSTTSVVHFWPGRVVHGDMDVGADGFYYATEGMISKMAVGRSGRYVLLLLSEGEGYLGLVHVELTPTPHTTFRKLELEGLPSVFDIRQISLDDSLGLVVVVDDEGGVTVASYL